ncbi:MAG: hypothetical protein D6785_05350, partial [Planctomycetota bacterium]
VIFSILFFFPLAVFGETVIQKGDKLNILVIGSGQPIQTYRVSQDGYILIAEIGKIPAAGKTVDTLEKILQKKYVVRYPNSKVAVTITPAVEAGRTIYVLGEVRNPGVFNIKTSISIVKAIAMAGGLTPKADARRIRVIHKDSPQSGEVFNWELFNKGKSSPIMVNPEDVVLVETRKFSHIFILGEVNTPGRYVIPHGISFMEALSLAGGLKGRMSPDATIIRAKDGKVLTIANIRQKLTSKEVLALIINPGDSLVISLTSQNSITIMGAVNAPGRYSIKGDFVDLLGALSLAGGTSQGAGQATIIRKDGSIQNIDLKNLSSIQNTKELPRVGAGDSVMVNRSIPQLIYVLGRVKSPGAFPINGPVSIHQALAMAGDITKWGSRNGLKILRANGKLETFDLEEALSSGNLKSIPRMQNGDTLYVP